MDAYSICRLYHHALLSWWEESESHDYSIPVSDIPLASVLIPLFKHHHPSRIILLASDGKIATLSRMEEASPPDFRIRRYMKVDNKSSISSIKNVVDVLYQLLSIDVDDQTRSISILDFIGLLKFILLLQTENVYIDFSLMEMTSYLRKQLYETPDFLKSENIDWSKMYRDRVIDEFYHTDRGRDELTSREKTLNSIHACHRMIERLCATIALQDERISWLEGKSIEPDKNVIDS